jgi:hypothetical protein
MVMTKQPLFAALAWCSPQARFVLSGGFALVALCHLRPPSFHIQLIDQRKKQVGDWRDSLP